MKPTYEVYVENDLRVYSRHLTLDDAKNYVKNMQWNFTHQTKCVLSPSGPVKKCPKITIKKNFN